MANFNLDDYEPVEVRIKKFYTDHKDGRIHTDMFFNDGERVVFKANLFVGDLLVSTGWAEEVKDTELQKTKDGREYATINYTSHVENCETSAIGRALANYNYSGDKRPSKEEMKKVQSAQPKQFTNTKATTPMTTGTTSNNATKAQMSWINQRLIEAGFDTEKADWASLTFQNASDYFNKKLDIDGVANILKLEK